MGEKRIAVFDFDSTLMDGETIDTLAKLAGVEREVKEITKAAMAGEIDFFESLTRRVRLLKGVEESAVAEACEGMREMEGGRELIKELKLRGYTVLCFSGGFRIATERKCRDLGVDAAFANELQVRGGRLTGEVGGEMMFDWSKGEMLRRMQNVMGVEIADTLVVGDGANDRSMFKYGGVNVSFCGKEILEAEADIVIREKDLRKVLDYLK